MLNKDGERELAYVARITDIIPIEGADRVEIAKINGWTCMVAKGAFKVGDLGIFFEADSKVPETEPFAFMEKRHYKVKVQKFFKGTVISDGLLMAAEDFGWHYDTVINAIGTGEAFGSAEVCYEEGDFLTKVLSVTYAEAEDNKRKANSEDKYKKMAQRKPNLFKKKWAKWMMKREWGRKVMFFFFGKKKDKKGGWPSWAVKTGEERCQNLPNLFPGDGTLWYATEKIDGTSTTFTMKGFGRKRQFLVCSRNVAFDKPDKKCFYETNVYTEMAEKYNMEGVLAEILDANKGDLEFVTIQGETYGEGIQKRTYGLKGRDLAVFNVIFGFADGRVERLNPNMMATFMKLFDIPTVPIVDFCYEIPETCAEMLEQAGGPSAVDGEMREGLVFRSYDGVRSFKAVDSNFIMKYHN